MEDSFLVRHIIEKDSNNSYHFQYPVIELLALVTGVDKKRIGQTRIYKRNLVRYIPFYSAQKGGGAITIGSATRSSITFTENFFSTDKNQYALSAYANDPDRWMGLAAHEVGHLHHTKRFKFLVVYLFLFAYQYMKYGHDNAPLEHEAEKGRDEYLKFSNWLRKECSSSVIDLIGAPESKEEKVKALNEYFEAYKNSKI